MTQNEFLQLEIGTVVSVKFKPDIYFVIYDTDQMGTAYRGKEYRVYGAREIECDTNFARIDINNCQFWKIEGKQKSESWRYDNMVWLDSGEYEKQQYIELRLYAPNSEKIRLDFNPLKISAKPDRNPTWEEWHCYAAPLRIYEQDYELLIPYFRKIDPIKNAFNDESVFDVCSDNWIAKDGWLKMILDIEQNLENVSDDEKSSL